MPAGPTSRPSQDTIPAWAYEIQSKITYQDKELAEIKQLAASMNRALRGENGEVGLVGRVDSLEKIAKSDRKSVV